MRRIIVSLVVIAVIIILLLLRIFPGIWTKKTQAVSNAKPVIPVEACITRDTSVIYQLSTIGTLHANESVEIVSEITKKVTAIPLKEGAYVNKGELLFKLDDAEIVTRLNKLRIEEKLAAANEARQKVELASGGISQEEYDATLNRLNTLKAEIEILKVDLDKTEIRAPFSGKIGLRSVSEGALVSPHTVLASLQDISRIKVDFSVPEKYASDLHPGTTILFSAEYSSKEYQALVEAIEPLVERKTRTISIRGISDNKDRSLVPGTSVRVDLNLRALNKQLFIPSAALIPTVKGYDVYLVKGGKAVLQPVETGIRSRFYVQVTAGLSRFDTVVVTNILRIKPGSPLKLVKLN